MREAIGWTKGVFSTQVNKSAHPMGRAAMGQACWKTDSEVWCRALCCAFPKTHQIARVYRMSRTSVVAQDRTQELVPEARATEAEPEEPWWANARLPVPWSVRSFRLSEKGPVA